MIWELPHEDLHKERSLPDSRIGLSGRDALNGSANILAATDEDGEDDEDGDGVEVVEAVHAVVVVTGLQFGVGGEAGYDCADAARDTRSERC